MIPLWGLWRGLARGDKREAILFHLGVLLLPMPDEQILINDLGSISFAIRSTVGQHDLEEYK